VNEGSTISFAGSPVRRLSGSRGIIGVPVLPLTAPTHVDGAVLEVSMRSRALHPFMVATGLIALALAALILVDPRGVRLQAEESEARQSDQQQPPFRSGTKTVAVYATVSENNGRLVSDLTRDDFEIREDGKVRPLTIFASENQPITIVVMLDKSGSMRASYGLVRAGAEAFVRRLTAGDKARIGTFSNKIVMAPEDFSNNQDGLISILRDGDRPEGPTPLWNAASEAVGALAAQQGRRVVLLFTDGADNPGNFKTTNLSLMDVMERAQRDDVMVYAIGLESRTPPMGGGGMPRGGLSGGFGGGNAFGIQRPDPGLPTIAGETGGGYFELRNADDLSGTFARVAEELHRQYALGFEPANLDGKTHKLEVKVKKPGLKVRARKHYVASK
jgi:Ca-activated chloride channel family protein